MSILRTSKFVRYIGSLARNIVLNNSRNIDGLLIKRQNLLFSQNYSAIAAATASQQQNENSIDRSIRRLDEEARRIGRVSKRELEEVIEEIKSARSATSSQSLMVIRCCGNLVPEETPELRTKLVNSVWQILDTVGVPMDISHYNALIRVYLENEHKFSPLEILAELEKKGIEPNRVTYQRLIAGYCQRGDIDGATQILEFMREKQMPISEGVFNALILGHSKAGDMQSARGILSVMGQAGLEPSSDTYAALLCGYASVGDADSLMAIFEECKQKDIYLADRDYLEIVFTLAINNRDNLVDTVLNKLNRTLGYNQDASNIILRLITYGKENIALKILETMVPPVKGDGQVAPTGGFFIKQLVKCNRPVESILNVCDQLKEGGFNSRGLIIATEIALQFGSVDLALHLLKAMRDNFYPIRNHYFWPLIIKKGNQNARDALEILKKMPEFKVVPNYETLRDYVLPYFAPNNIKDVSSLISELQPCGVSVGAAAASLVGHFLNKDDIKLAADVAVSFKANYTVTVPQRLLVSAFLKTNDADSFVRIINALVQSRDTRRDTQREEEDEEYLGFDNREFVGRILLNVVGKSHSVNITELLQKMADLGLGISNSTAEQFQSQLSGSELTTEVSSLLSRLVSADIAPVRLTRQGGSVFLPRNEESSRNLIEKLKAKGDPALNLKRQLFSLLCANRDLNKVLDYKKELEDEGYVFTAGMRAVLIELYLFHNDLESALKEYDLLLKNDPDIKLDNLKTIKLATGLVQADRLDDALGFLKKQFREEGAIEKEKDKDKPFVYSAACWRLLNTLAEKGDTEGVRKVFDSLVENKFIEPNNALLGPLVKAHIVKDDLKGALEVYEWCTQHYRATPFKNELACKLIQKEDANELQRLTDLSTTVHGEINSLHDLIFAFVECGRIRQARKILETPGLRVRSDRLSYAGERYQNEGLVEPLEALVKATKDISQVDRASLFYQLLLSYKKADDVEKAVGLWTQMQEEDVQPTDEFLHELGIFLESKNEPVPFVIPEARVKQESIPDNVPSSEIHRKLQNAISNKNWPEALKEYTLLKNSNARIYPTEISGFLELAINSADIKEAFKFVKEWLTNGVVIPRYKLYYFAKTLSKTGDVQRFQEFGNYLTDDQKSKTKYKNLMCNCYIGAGKTEELLAIMEDNINKASTTKELETVYQNFPNGGLLAILDSNSNLLPRVEKLAERCASFGLLNSINMLWLHYLNRGEDEKAEAVFKKYLKTSQKLMFRFLQNEAKKNQEEMVIDKLLSFLNRWDHVNSRHFGIAHSAKIDIWVSKNEPEKALAYFEEVIKEVQPEDINQSTLNRLKSSLAAKNIEFPYSVSRPKRSKRSNVDELSDSDNEEMHHKSGQ